MLGSGMIHRFAALLWASLTTLAVAAPDFNRDVRPILSERCFHCHGPDEKKRFAGLRLDTPEGATQLRNGKAAVVPGRPEDSELIRRITLPAGPQRMPMDKDALPVREVVVLREWIRAGARYEQHWSYSAPVRAVEPKVRRPGWATTPIDRFILARLEAEGLSPSKEAGRATLLRRLSLDLTGLPPSLEELDSFERDTRPDAYEKAVDSLLASPHFGEKWARHWLDLARFAESSGYQHDDLHSIWPYRDWVVNAFNQDMPFTRFTIEQLAGDLLPDATIDQKIATGFHRNSNANLGGDITLDESRHNVRVDRVNTTGIVWLATTIGCAQCHTHKYDPIRIQDYYRMYAYFQRAEDDVMPDENPASQRKRYIGATVFLPVPDDRQRRYRQARSAFETARGETKAVEARYAAEIGKWEAGQAAGTKLPANIAAILKRPVSRRNEIEAETLLAFYLAGIPEVKAQRESEKKARAAMLALEPPSSLVMSERAQSVVTHVLLRGNLGSPGEPVEPGPPAAIGPSADGLPPNRLGLAQWLVDRRNPLTARVAVNRLWAEIFGTGLVATTEDFGHQGEPPSHPELLDWLAVEFMDHGWSMKHMIRLIVTSAAYRQGSSATPELLAKDPDNRLLARGPRFRLDAEAIRDVALFAAGLLSPRIGGPSVYPPQPAGLWKEIAGAEVADYRESSGENRYRRALYTFWRRGNPYPTFLNFDASPRMECAARRIRTNTPIQALTLLNDPVFVEAAAALAQRMVTEISSGSVEQRVSYGFRLCASRAPQPSEAAALVDLFRRTRQRHGTGEEAERAAWQGVARALLNLDETITKG